MKEIARILKITPRTVAFHKYSMMEDLGIKTSAELVQYADQASHRGRLAPPTCRIFPHDPVISASILAPRDRCSLAPDPRRGTPSTRPRRGRVHGSPSQASRSEGP